MKTEIAPIAAKDLEVIEYRDLRVVTTEQLATGYGATEQMITNNFNRNKDRFIEGKHYFKLNGEDVEILRNSFRGVQISAKARSLTLWTERGAANHAKMLESDQSWDFYNDLTEFYFTRRDALPVTNNALPDLSRLQILELALESEKGRLAEKERADHAVRTKSQISRKREAVAMGKLSASSRKVKVLSERLGESQKHATVTAVQNATGNDYKFAPLRKWCRENNLVATDVPDPRYGSVKSWPAEAWLAVYGVDLAKLFGVKK